MAPLTDVFPSIYIPRKHCRSDACQILTSALLLYDEGSVWQGVGRVTHATNDGAPEDRYSMESALTVILLPFALAVVMFGLGLSLVIDDFTRVVRFPKAAITALAVQLLVLPGICFGLVILFGLPGEIAVGMMLLAAAPGGTTANLFSHIARADVALNITLTAINSVISVFTLPIVVNLSILFFIGTERNIALQPLEMLKVVVIVLVPVAIGMFVRRRLPNATERLLKPIKIASIVILFVIIVLALVSNLDVLREHVVTVGAVALILCSTGLLLGYWIPRLFRVDRRQAIAATFEVGIQNATVAITIALVVLGNEQMAIGPAIYGVLMYIPALAALYILRRTHRAPKPADVTADAGSSGQFSRG